VARSETTLKNKRGLSNAILFVAILMLIFGIYSFADSIYSKSVFEHDQSTVIQGVFDHYDGSGRYSGIY
jgi:hypothetical protein